MKIVTKVALLLVHETTRESCSELKGGLCGQGSKALLLVLVWRKHTVRS